MRKDDLKLASEQATQLFRDAASKYFQVLRLSLGVCEDILKAALTPLLRDDSKELEEVCLHPSCFCTRAVWPVLHDVMR